ncbi:ATP-grasp domain-containing protein [Myxococcus sp. Y35]|uniref:ATP-grasp domain-containing protein n=1 Tax=Pseudomyxococcus flavus TaxID=3115648 RepID=UPI003CE77F22
MIRSAFIQEYGAGRMEPEMRALLDELLARGIPVETFTEKRLSRGQLPLARDVLVAGDVPTVLGALRQLGIDAPETQDYPPSLSPFLHRRVWRSTVRQLTADVLYGSVPPVFAKPRGRRKRFTGHVFARADDLLYLERASASTDILCSEVVRWLSEYRAFVVRGDIVGIRNYGGDPSQRVDEESVRQAIQCLESAGEGTAGYAVDFGVLEPGQTALVEWNDGFSLGAYGLERGPYTDLTLARWLELTQSG